MAAKIVLVFCAQALLAQIALSQCLARGSGLGGIGYGSGLSGYGSGCGCGSASGVASTGGGLPVSSCSPIAPVGLSVVSENAYEGQLAASGNLPFLGGVSIEGALPTAGSGAVSYGCGNGATTISAENGPIATGIGSGNVFPPSAPSAGLAGLGYGSGLAGLGAGYGAAGLGYGSAGLGYGSAGLGYGLNAGAGCGCGAY